MASIGVVTRKGREVCSGTNELPPKPTKPKTRADAGGPARGLWALRTTLRTAYLFGGALYATGPLQRDGARFTSAPNTLAKQRLSLSFAKPRRKGFVGRSGFA